jgi:arginyl-tRNA--protein-N-Asp/Glu arginylyltransferase
MGLATETELKAFNVIDRVSPDPFGEFRVEWSATPKQMDTFWAEGWRHFGPFFFRRYFMESGEGLKAIQPLRIQLDQFRASKSQRRILRRNQDLLWEVKPTVLDEIQRRLFSAHVQRFRFNVPPSLESFLGLQPDTVPCENVTIAVRAAGRLVAASFLDVGHAAVSSVYAVFHPEESQRSLGIFTMLKEMEYALGRGCTHYYPGYACHQSSPYDYKKRFSGTQWYDWRGGWHPLPQDGA